jgi:FlaA1/EpsC-like NDP-sugar epimerase
VSRIKKFIDYNIAAPKWFVLIFDTIISGLSILIAGYLAGLALFPTGSLSVSYQLLMVSVTYALFFFFFRTGEILPGPSDFKNVLRSLDALSGAFVALMLLNLFLKMTGRPPLISNIVLIFHTIFSVLIIGGYRFIAAIGVRNSMTSAVEKTGSNVIDNTKEENDFQQHSQPVLQILRSKKILITGAAGSIGGKLAQQAAAFGRNKIILCDINENGLYSLEVELKRKYPAANLSFVIADTRNELVMENIFQQFHPQLVMHAAAYKHVSIMETHPGEAIRNNVYGTKVMADLSVKYKTERFLLISTDKANNPSNVMVASKRIAEMYVQAIVNTNRQQSITKFIITRLGNVLGSSGSVIPRFKEQIASGGPVTITHPDITRYFMPLSEACALLLQTVTMDNGVYRFDMGKPVKIADLANKMIINAGLKPGVDIRVTYTGLRPGEKLFEEQLDKAEEVVSPTNKKILIANVPVFDFDHINNGINQLMNAASENNDKAVVRQMKIMVPEFLSNNSEYETLDKERAGITVNRFENSFDQQ